MYFVLLKFVVGASHRYRIYLDIKDTRGGAKAKKLHEVLANKFHDFEHKSVERVQQVRSHESDLLQLADLLIGALSYANRGLKGSPAKNEIVAMLQAAFGANALTRTSKFDHAKFNILLWDPREAAG
jgi:hypothetical protein